MNIAYGVKSYFTFLRGKQQESYFRTNLLLWALLVVANIIDLAFTYSVLSRNGAEVNPAMLLLIRNFGAVSIAYAKGLLLGILFMLLPFIRDFLQKMLFVPVIVYTVLIVSHVLRFV